VAKVALNAAKSPKFQPFDMKSMSLKITMVKGQVYSLSDIK